MGWSACQENNALEKGYGHILDEMLGRFSLHLVVSGKLQ